MSQTTARTGLRFWCRPNRGVDGLQGCEDGLVVTSAEVEEAFARFVEDAEPRLLRALVGAFGSEVGREAARDALAYAWEHWSRVEGMDNPVGYLFRVGQSRSRSYRRDRALFPEVPPRDLPEVDGPPPKSWRAAYAARGVLTVVASS